MLNHDTSLNPDASATTPESVPATTPSGSVSTAKPRLSSMLLEFTIVCMLVLVLGVVMRVFVTQVYAISGHSMEPTLHDGEMVLINKLTPLLAEIERGDLVIFSAPDNSRKDLIKRVIGLPGDVVRIEDHDLWVNGEKIRERYARRAIYEPDKEWKIAEGELLVFGDNRPQSQDSRKFGPIQIESVKGEVFLRLWPFSNMSTLP